MPSTIVSIPPQESLFHCGLDEAIQLPVDFQSLPLEAVAGVPVLSDYDRFVGNRMSQESKRSAAGRCERVRLPNAPAVACGHGSQTRILCKTA